MQIREPSRQRTRSSVRAAALDDAASPIIRAIVALVPASRWAFGRVNGDNIVEQFLSLGPSGGLEDLSAELKRQRARSQSGARIAATLGPLGDAESSITILFADERSTFGILTLSRAPELGSFTSNEISILTLAIGTTTEHLALLRRRQPSEPTPLIDSMRELPTTIGHVDSACFVLDDDFRIVLTLGTADRGWIEWAGVRAVTTDRLPQILEATVRELTATWNQPGDERIGREARPVPFLVVRTSSVAGPLGSFIGVRIERLHASNSLRSAAMRFHISTREVQVLELLLDGKRISEIGGVLHIASSTVQDHIRNMMEKTGSRNRSDLIARIFGWEFAS
jgi:DNA-binding CsgD family transcriptional regulator